MKILKVALLLMKILVRNGNVPVGFIDSNTGTCNPVDSIRILKDVKRHGDTYNDHVSSLGNTFVEIG